MKIINLLVLFALGLCVSGCATTCFHKPEGFTHEGRKDIVALKVLPATLKGFPPDASYQNSLLEYMKTKFVDSDRFVVLANNYTGDYSRDYSAVFEVKPEIGLISQTPHASRKMYLVETTVDCKRVDIQDGAYDEAFRVKGVSSQPDVVPLRFGQPHSPDFPGLCSQSFRRVMAHLEGELAIRYPVTGAVTIKNYGDQTTFHINKGSADGVDASDDFLIYAVDEDGNDSAAVALCKGEVGKNRTRLTIQEWQCCDPEVKEEIIPRIRKNDAALKLFAVCRKTDVPGRWLECKNCGKEYSTRK